MRYRAKGMAEKLKQADLKVQLASAESELQSLLNRAQALRDWITATRKLCGKQVQPATPHKNYNPRRKRY
jgi:uncharacterized protein YgfB (UPF0149 family)